MQSNTFQNACQRTDLDWIVMGNDFVIFSIPLRSDTNVRAGLTRGFIAQYAQCLYEAGTVDVPGQSHWMRTSSRTKWRRMIFGTGMDSSK